MGVGPLNPRPLTSGHQPQIILAPQPFPLNLSPLKPLTSAPQRMPLDLDPSTLDPQYRPLHLSQLDLSHLRLNVDSAY